MHLRKYFVISDWLSLRIDIKTRQPGRVDLRRHAAKGLIRRQLDHSHAVILRGDEEKTARTIFGLDHRLTMFLGYFYRALFDQSGECFSRCIFRQHNTIR